MEEEEESSDSNCSSDISHTSKRAKITERFKGVVPQQNGHWGAQIYAHHRWICLGTFKSEIEAAMAYDTATIRLCTGDLHRNFPWTHISAQEASFQNQFTTDAVMNMIGDGSYSTKFSDFLMRSQQSGIEIGMNPSTVHGHKEFYCTLLFKKELTPSDVGKLNRLVIPKRYAVEHFPNVPNNPGNKNSLDDAKRLNEIQLEFYDKHMHLWTFRYCYWKSSQSFVFTRGWNKFVKKNGLRACDTIGFYLYESRDGFPLGKSFIMIDVARKDDDPMKDVRERKMEGGDGSNGRKGFRLFGVQIE